MLTIQAYGVVSLCMLLYNTWTCIVARSTYYTSLRDSILSMTYERTVAPSSPILLSWRL